MEVHRGGVIRGARAHEGDVHRAVGFAGAGGGGAEGDDGPVIRGDGEREVGGGAKDGVGGRAEADKEGFGIFRNGIVEDRDIESLAGFTCGERHESGDGGVIRPGSGRAVEREVIHGAGGVRRAGAIKLKGDGVSAFGDGEARGAEVHIARVVVREVNNLVGREHGADRRIADGEREGLGVFLGVVLQQHQADGLVTLAGGERERAAGRCVIRSSGSRAVGHGIVNRDAGVGGAGAADIHDNGVRAFGIGAGAGGEGEDDNGISERRHGRHRVADAGSVVCGIRGTGCHAGGRALIVHVRVGEIRNACAGGIGHDRAVGDAVIADETVAIGIIKRALAGGVLAVVHAAHVVTELMGKGVVAAGIGTAHDAEAVTGKIRGDVRHHVAEAGVGGLHGLGEEADQVRAVLIAEAVSGIHVAIAGVLQAGEVGGGITGFRVGDFAAIDEVQGDRNEAVLIGIVGLSDREVDQRVHGGLAAGTGLGGDGVNDHDIHIGV